MRGCGVSHRAEAKAASDEHQSSVAAAAAVAAAVSPRATPKPAVPHPFAL